MEIRRCMKCMQELGAGETVCPKCGQVSGKANAEPFALKPGTILDGKYLVGEMLGQGGFGITYIGFDLLLEQKVAIKEYFPMSTGMVSRDNRSTVVWSSAMMRKTGAERGFDSFLKEARKMAKLGGIPGVVGVKSVFIQNETAYIVMDFVEGETLLKKLQREGPMDFDTCLSLLMPIMQALEEVHKHGIIHRDISPDNIMVQKDGKLILLDLGAAKDLDMQKADGTVQSSQMVAKAGFSPFEQYGRSGQIGPWTDVYAMAATIYYCCTGIVPPVAPDRVMSDSLACKPLLTKQQFDALALGMTIMPKDRLQDMNALMRILTPEPKSSKTEVPPKAPPKQKEPKPEQPKQKEPKQERPKQERPKQKKPKPERTGDEPRKRKAGHKSKLPKWLIPAAATGVAVLGIVMGIGAGGEKKQEIPVSVETSPTKASTAPTDPEETKETLPETVPVKVHVMAEPESTILEEDKDSLPFWGQTTYTRGDVETITFLSTMKGVPGDALDVSDALDRSVLVWMKKSDLYVAADGMIAPNPNASCMFASFTNLKTIDFGGCFDTSGVTDMGFLFDGCGSLTDLNLSGFDTSNVTNMNWMFSDCSSLTSLGLSGLDTSNVTDMESMFYDCSSLTSLNLSGFDTANVTDMSWMFFGCGSLTSLNLSGFDTANVTDMNAMFSGCSSLTDLNLTSFDTANVMDMGWMFSGCKSLTGLDLSNFNTARVTDMKRMFSDCRGLTSLDISNFDASNVADMAQMFYGCGRRADLQCSDSKILAAYNSR